MDKSKHMVSLPLEDYEELLKNQIDPHELRVLQLKASLLQIHNPGPRQKSELHISTKVPCWFHLGELHVYQDKTNRVMKKYKLVELEDNRLDEHEVYYQDGAITRNFKKDYNK